jgi:hypothetical protein
MRISEQEIRQKKEKGKEGVLEINERYHASSVCPENDACCPHLHFRFNICLVCRFDRARG